MINPNIYDAFDESQWARVWVTSTCHDNNRYNGVYFLRGADLGEETFILIYKNHFHREAWDKTDETAEHRTHNTQQHSRTSHVAASRLVAFYVCVSIGRNELRELIEIRGIIIVTIYILKNWKMQIFATNLINISLYGTAIQ